jgi:histidyl-tRNA synthetase
VVGSKSLLNEIELTNVYAAVFEKLQLPVEIRINSRKILAALSAVCGGSEMLIPITIAIDKLDKIGLEKVKDELLNNGLTTHQISIIEKYLLINGTNDQKIAQIKNLLGENEMGKAGIEEIEYVLNNVQRLSLNASLIIDLTLARGLNYYTGIIFEVKAIGAQMGSIGGGGRYDDLTGLFGVPNVPGVGISFGVDRIYDVLEELHLFPVEVQKGTKVLFFNLGESESKKSYELMQALRSRGIASELFHENTKIDKQFKYAEKKNIPYVIILGDKELAIGTCNIKNIQTGEQKTILQNELAQQLF